MPIRRNPESRSGRACSSSPTTRAMICPTAGQDIRINSVIVVFDVAAASQPTTSSNARVCQAPCRAHGTRATTTPCRRQATRARPPR